MIAEKTRTLSREALFTELYTTVFPGVALFVRKMGGTFDDARDVFQDALVIYYEKRARPDSEPEHQEEAYVFGIARHLWYKKFRKDLLLKPLDLSAVEKTQEIQESTISPE